MPSPFRIGVMQLTMEPLEEIVDLIVGLRPTEDREREGLDITDHGERAYNY